MKTFFKGLLTASLILVASGANAQHQVYASGTMGASDLGVGKLNKFDLAITGAYRYAFDEMIQGEFQLEFANLPGGKDRVTNFGFGVGPVFNFMGDLKNSAFAALIGVYSKAGSAKGQMSADLRLGKRFEIATNVSYEPSLNLTYEFSDAFKGDRMDATLTFLAVTVSFE